jgi:neurotransmitter:Na+ symporter, NSS family
MAREIWHSRKLFLFASIGCAVGIASMWRLPALALEYGGLTFFIPYLLILLFIGVPLLILEFAIGQRFKSSALSALTQINPKFKGVGLAGVFCASIFLMYICVILAWSLIYVVQSFSTILPWTFDAQNHFFMNVIEISNSPDNLGSVVWQVFLALIIVWVTMYALLKNGIIRIQKNIQWLVLVPVLAFVGLFIYILTLPGAIYGIVQILKPNYAALFNPQLWTSALSQVLLTLTLSFGAMVAYASHNDRFQNIKNDAYLTAIFSTIVSFIITFSVFGILGYMSVIKQVSISSLIVSGPGLFFSTIPTALATVFAPKIMSALFFLLIFALGLTTAFALLHSISLTAYESLFKFKKTAITLFVVSVLFIFSLPFVTQGAFYFIDVIDHYLISFSILFLTLALCLIFAWGYGADSLRQYINARAHIKIGSWWNGWITYVIPFILLLALVCQTRTEFISPYGNYPFWLTLLGWGLVFVPIIFVVVYLIFGTSTQDKSLK